MLSELLGRDFGGFQVGRDVSTLLELRNGEATCLQVSCGVPDRLERAGFEPDAP